ncbi:hypothetical protein FB451DRAFT_1027618, partial [Mycena latifolia]
SAKKRPTQVSDWISRARVHTPTIKDTAAYEQQFWTWWKDINPAWHKSETPMGQDKDGPWAVMEYYSQNGFLNVLMALKWWRDALPAESKGWDAAVTDVMWVLGRMEA